MDLLVLFLVVGGIIGGTIMLSMKANSSPRKPSQRDQFREEAKKDGYTYIYDCFVAIHPDRIMRVAFQDGNLDLKKSEIRSVAWSNDHTYVYVQTRNIDHPRLELRPGYQANDLYHRLVAMIS